ncbi:MAG: hypothetical protein LH630_03505 [Actinomycetia bacterium]|nr:hypothetical protein [Actinomycetes bacterium]
MTTNYAHPSMPQLAFYDRLCGWVTPGGTLLVVGDLRTAGTGMNHQPKRQPPSTTSPKSGPQEGEIVTAEEHVRTLTAPDGGVVPLRDVAVRATHRGPPETARQDSTS